MIDIGRVTRYNNIEMSGKKGLENALKTLSCFCKILLDDEPLFERCRNKNNDAVGFYDYKNKCFWFYDLDFNRWVKEKPKNYLTQEIIKELKGDE